MNSDINPQPPPLPTRGNNGSRSSEVRRLMILWGVCCMSPIMYLAASALIKNSLMTGSGFFPFTPPVYRNALTGLAIWVAGLQCLHLYVKHRYRPLLLASAEDTRVYISKLTRRTMILITISELAVFAGFCLFILQGTVAPVFAAGISAMLLYAQSHPRAANPVDHR